MRSEAQKRADKKYKNSGKCKYKTVGVMMHEDNISKLAEFAASSNMTLPKYLARSAYYCALNDIDLTQFDQDFRSKKDGSEKP